MGPKPRGYNACEVHGGKAIDEHVYEGTWEEVAAHAEDFAGKHVRLTVVEEAPPKPEPNHALLELLHQTEELQRGMRFTDGSDTQRLLREARSGAMYGYEPIED